MLKQRRVYAAALVFKTFLFCTKMFYSPYYRPSFQSIRLSRPAYRPCYDDEFPNYRISVDENHARTVRQCDSTLNDIGQICVDQLKSSATKEDHVNAFKSILNLLGVKYDKQPVDDECKKMTQQIVYQIIQKLFLDEPQQKQEVKQEVKEEPKQAVKEDPVSVTVKVTAEDMQKILNDKVKSVSNDDVNKILNDTIDGIIPQTSDLNKTLHTLCQLFLTPPPKPVETSTKQAESVLDEFLTTTI